MGVRRQDGMALSHRSLNKQPMIQLSYRQEIQFLEVIRTPENEYFLEDNTRNKKVLPHRWTQA